MSFFEIFNIKDNGKFNSNNIYIIISLIIFIIIFALTVFNDIFPIYINCILFITLIILSASFVYFFYFYKNGNMTNLPGIGFYIKSSNLLQGDNRNEMFFDKLRSKLSDRFNLIIYKNKEFENCVIKDRFFEIMNRKNLFLLFVVSENSGSIDGKHYYNLSIENLYFYSNLKVGRDISNYLMYDINNCFDINMYISEENSLIDSDNNSLLFKIKFLYLLSIIYIISLTPLNALNILKELDFCLSKYEESNKNIDFIKNNIIDRYCECYCNSILILFNNNDYVQNGEYLEDIISLITEYENFLNKNHVNGKIHKKKFVEYYNDILIKKALYYYLVDDIDSSMECVNLINNDYGMNLGYLLDRAFFESLKTNYDNSFKLYNRLNNNPSSTDFIMNDNVCYFFERQNEQFPDNNSIIFCLACCNLFFKDKEVANKWFDELLEKDYDTFNDVIKRIRLRRK